MSNSRVVRWFRMAKAASPGWNLAKTFCQSAVFWVVFLLALPLLIRRAEGFVGVHTHPVAWLSPCWWGLFLAASCIGVWSGATMALAGRGTPLPTDCPRRLVITGPYAYVRNPMAIAGLTQGAAVGLLLGSTGVLIYVVVGGLLWNGLVRPVEEAHLKHLFGQSFIDYQGEVRCWLPRLVQYSPSGREACDIDSSDLEQ